MVYLRWADCKDKLTDDQRELLLALDGGEVQADDLVERTQIPVRRVLSALTLLQIQGYVTEESGKRFRAAVKLKME
ncbi:MAG: DNA-protecting protein DprA, partial [Oscillospiraceae bacterium]|nr:DNA-protecting protein DprA [Oscillospiraceae bacterium]